MALIDHIYLDAALNDQFDDATDTLGAAAVNGQSGDGYFFVGDPDPAIAIKAASNPGTDNITLEILDSASGSGVEKTHIKLAISQAALDSATGGADLSIGQSIPGGDSNAVQVWYRWDNSTGSDSAEISLSIVARVEEPV